ncbi:pentapeptide repeat-containing protein [Nocardia blacklockiae]|uniref:pentapeptide repeat-containing protein n=1 Tax=Nocardia blacklockiae TaxID=480036 RepID=UPI001892E8D7|nr:pentapeptide repeat-containing protein [Nocardia blacklockiae]MBF6172333.1 pentapeptide repeat-containing protein [Nocardia blacklockiae]
MTSLEIPEPSRRRKIFRRIRNVATWSGWTKLAAIAATVGILAGLYFNNRSSEFNTRTLEASSKQYAVGVQTAVTDRYAKAVEELASDKTEIRLGGIYLLERLATDSPSDRRTIYDLLSAFIRKSAPNTSACELADDPDGTMPSIDVQAALTVLGRRAAGGEQELNLMRTCLRGADLTRADLRNVNFSRSSLESAQIVEATLSGSLFYVDFSGANLAGARFQDLTVQQSRFDGAAAPRMRMNNTQIVLSLMCRMQLDGADLGNSDILDVDLRGIHIETQDSPWPVANFAGARFGNIAYDDESKWPAGFAPPPNDPTLSDHLKLNGFPAALVDSCGVCNQADCPAS